MKVVLTGSTGLIGSAVLKRCLEHPSITAVVTLSRRELTVKHPKLQAVIHNDYLQYDDGDLEQLQGAEACIWCLGAPTAGRDVHYDYTLAGVNAFESYIAPHLGAGKRFRFVYVSGAFVEKDQDKRLWFLSETRKMRGEVERDLAHFAKLHADTWESITARPAVVCKDETSLTKLLPGWTIQVADLAAALVELALQGNEAHCVESADLRRIGKAALQPTL